MFDKLLKKMKSFHEEDNVPLPFQVEALPEHFDAIDAVQMGEYYDRGITLQNDFDFKSR